MSKHPLWEEIFSSRAWGKYPAEELIRFVAQNFYAWQPRHMVQILEAGFGTGANLWFAAREGFTVHGLEGAQAGVDFALARLDAEVPGWRNQGAQLRCADIAQPLPYEAGRFDLVIDSDAVTCNSFAASCAIYRELYRVTRPGGRLYVRTPALGSWGSNTGNLCGPDAWQCSEGPFAGTGCVRFTREAQLPELLGSWRIDAVEKVSRTLAQQQQHVTEWVVNATRVDE